MLGLQVKTTHDSCAAWGAVPCGCQGWRGAASRSLHQSPEGPCPGRGRMCSTVRVVSPPQGPPGRCPLLPHGRKSQRHLAMSLSHVLEVGFQAGASWGVDTATWPMTVG